MNEHIPVMLEEVLSYINVKKGNKYIDATLGAGGYAKAILQKGGEVLGIDQDPRALEIARRNLSACPGPFKLINSNFSKIGKVARENGFEKVSGIVFDLGFASFQINDPSRGISFLKDGPLDMRMDPNLGVTAADLINTLPKQELNRVFTEYGGEPNSWAITQAVVKRREQSLFHTTTDLANVTKAVSHGAKSKIHPATRVFQALRIAVNTEMDNLQSALGQTTELLESGGRLIMVSFHSGEDRIVKNFLSDQENQGKMIILTKKPTKPTTEEISNNPRARSAVLRYAELV